MCCVLSQYFKGLALACGSGMRHAFRSILTATVPSSTNFTLFELDLVTGLNSRPLGIGGLNRAPLYLIMNIIPPS